MEILAYLVHLKGLQAQMSASLLKNATAKVAANIKSIRISVESFHGNCPELLHLHSCSVLLLANSHYPPVRRTGPNEELFRIQEP